MAIQNKLLKIERDAQKFVRLSELGAQTLVKLDLNYTDLIIRDNKGVEQARYENATRDDRRRANDEASFLDEEANPEGAPHTIEAKSAITFKEDGTLDFGDTGLGDVFPTAEIEALIYDIETYTDCENIKQMIKDHTKVLEDQLKAHAPEIANLAAINGLLSLPSDPLKILSWARKVVNTFFGPYTMALIDLAIQLALFASALARLAGAVSVAEQNLKLCAIDIIDDATTAILDEIDSTLNTVFEDIDDVMDKIDDAQTKISEVTGSTKRFLPSREGLTLGENITQNARSKLAEKLNDQVNKAFPAGSVDLFKSDLATYAAIPLDQDPKAQADSDAAANAMNEALGLPPIGSAVPGNIEVVIDGATFTFQNGMLVQATGTNSGTGTGISTNSQTSASTMAGFVGAEWDGTIPAHVELITSFEGYGYGGEGTTIETSDVGPFGPIMTGNTKKWYIPNNLKVSCAKFNLRNDRAGFGRGIISFVDGAGFSDLWRGGLGTIHVGLVIWMSATPGGSPLTDAYGTPVVTGGSGSDQDIRFAQGYDLSLITDDGIGQTASAKGAGQIGIFTNGTPFYATSTDGFKVVLPIATKTFFFNVALVTATDASTFIANGTAPGASDLVQFIPDPAKTGDDYNYYVSQLPNQFRVASFRSGGDVNMSLTQFLAKTFIRKDSANTIYNGTDTTMESFIGSTWDGTYSSNTQLITGWQYTDGTSVTSNGLANTDIGFVSDTPIRDSSSSPFMARKYPIPLNGKISTSDFSVGWGGSDSVGFDFDYRYYLDRNNSTFDLTWAAPDDNLSRAWYDLDLMPVAWMSDTPGGAARTLVDGSTGKVIKLEQAGATYKAQQLLSTTKSLGADRATLPIVQKTFFLNVAVVSANTATSLVSSGTAPTANQCISWSVTDPALGYTGSGDQHLKFELGSRTTDRSDKAIPKT